MRSGECASSRQIVLTQQFSAAASNKRKLTHDAAVVLSNTLFSHLLCCACACSTVGSRCCAFSLKFYIPIVCSTSCLMLPMRCTSYVETIRRVYVNRTSRSAARGKDGNWKRFEGKAVVTLKTRCVNSIGNRNKPTPLFSFLMFPGECPPTDMASPQHSVYTHRTVTL